MATAEKVLSPKQWWKAVHARGQCARCPRTERLHAHHIDRDPTNNTLENGECLCVWCHDAEHNAGGSIVALDDASRKQGPRSEDTRRKISESLQGHPVSEDARRKISEVARNPSEETRRRMSEAHLGKKHTEDTRRKMSESHRGHTVSAEARRKIGAASRVRVPWNKGLRKARDEAAFTLAELLVVILIIGILAAISVPTFLAQVVKSKDVAAKELVHTAEVVAAAYANEHGTYVGLTPSVMHAEEPSIEVVPSPDRAYVSEVHGGPTGYSVTATAAGGDTFGYAMGEESGTVERFCSPAGHGGCHEGGSW